MTVTAIVGAQWGDEGKGRIVDYLAQREMVIRFQGGDNAGHTVVNEHGTFRLHLVPSGIFNPATRWIIGAGTVVNPDTLLEEMAELTRAGISLDNLWLSERAQVVMPYHRLLDGLEESARGGQQIGTTKRGHRPGLRRQSRGPASAWAIYAARLIWALAQALPQKNLTLQHFGQPPLSLEDLVAQATAWGKMLGPRIVDTLPMVRDAVRSGQKVLLEGQLGVMRDLDWGTYPFVTSSNPIAGGAGAGAGLPPSVITDVVGVVKAYLHGGGGRPIPDRADRRDRRAVFDRWGKSTARPPGRPRRCGWLDGVALPYATWLDGFTALAITKLDVLDELADLKICTGYRLDGRMIERVPDTPDYERCEPIYETWAGWQTSTRDARSWRDLPWQAQAYLRRIEALTGVPIRYISVGPEREQLVVI